MLEKVLEGLKEIVFTSEDIASKEKALELLLLVNSEIDGIIRVDNFRIPKKIYQESIALMIEDRKIMAIKTLKNGLDLGLKEAKLLSERISIIERIPMASGYQL